MQDAHSSTHGPVMKKGRLAAEIDFQPQPRFDQASSGDNPRRETEPALRRR